jgi:hypothetical protein
LQKAGRKNGLQHPAAAMDPEEGPLSPGKPLMGGVAKDLKAKGSQRLRPECF